MVLCSPVVARLHNLASNYPNPFNPVTTIGYTVETHHDAPLPIVNIYIYNLLGQKIATLVSKKQPAGQYSVQWDASDLPSGTYLYQLTVSNPSSNNGENSVIYRQMRKMILMK